jgi:hypothetical protein
VGEESGGGEWGMGVWGGVTNGPEWAEEAADGGRTGRGEAPPSRAVLASMPASSVQCMLERESATGHDGGGGAMLKFRVGDFGASPDSG